MSHRDYAPNTTFPRGDARLAVIDLFAFPNPSDRSKSILIMDVHPSSGVNPPEHTTAEPFSPDALYEIKIDTDADGVADIAYQARFTRSESGATEVRLWARTLARSNEGSWVQVERCARVLQARFLGGDQSEAYGAADPKDDAQFVDLFANSLQRTGGLSLEEARRVARTLLPDLLPYDPERPVFYPLNGRRLSDDAVDSFLTVVTNGEVTHDGIGPHGDLLAEFPYVGVPHLDRENLVEVPRN